MWFLYIVRCSDDTLYTGISNNVDDRIVKHNSGKASKYTRVRRPVILLYTENFETKGQALRREAAVKRLTRTNKQKLVEKIT